MSEKICEAAKNFFEAVDGANSWYGQIQNDHTWTNPDDCIAQAINGGFQYPLVSLTTKSSFDVTPEGTISRDIPYVIGHYGFYMWNLINCGIMLLFHGYVFGRWSKNPLIKWCFLACFFQLTSCVTGMIRYKINDEMGHHTIVVTLSNITTIFAYSFMNYVNTLIFVNSDKLQKPQLVKQMMAFWIFCGTFTLVVTLAFWDTVDFSVMRKFFAFSTFCQLVAHGKGASSFKNQKICLPSDFFVENKAVHRMFVVCMAGTVVSMACGLTGWIIMQYPGAGFAFVWNMIAMTFFGEMDFISPNFVPR